MGIRKNRLMRIISLAMALLLLLLTASCGGSAGEPAENKPDKPGASNTLQESDAQKDGKSDQDQSNADDKQDAGMSAASEHNTPSDSYTAYVEAKAELSSLLIDALSSRQFDL